MHGTTRTTPRRARCLAAALVLAAGVPGAPAGAAEAAASIPPPVRFSSSGTMASAGDYLYAEPRVVRRRVPTSAFRPGRNHDEETWWIDSSGYGAIIESTAAFQTNLGLFASLDDVPAGARLTSLACNHYDDHDVEKIFVLAKVWRRPVDGTAAEDLAFLRIESEGASAEVHRAAVPLDHTVAEGHDYWLRVGLVVSEAGQELRFYGCELVYEVSRLGPR